MLSNILSELQALDQWVCWQYEERNGRPTKVPRQSNGDLASATNPATWTSFSNARDAVEECGFSGLGFVFTESDPYIGIDVDGSIDDELVQFMDSYTERSPSGTGVHIFIKGELPDGGRGRRSGKLEVYARERFFTMTGQVYHDAPIRSDAEKLAQFMAYFPERNETVLEDVVEGEPPLRDDEVLTAVRTSAQSAVFAKLWDGDWQDTHESQSDADAALLSRLRFWTGGHRAQSLRLFGQSMLGRRDKWSREDYQVATWDAINRGIVRDIAPVDIRVPMFLRPDVAVEAGLCDVEQIRQTCDAAVRTAIRGTVLGALVTELEAVTDPPLPLALTLPKAYAIAGAALTSRTSNPLASGGRGVGLAKVVINTTGGQACNVYALTVSESATGKDIGGVLSSFAHERKWHIGGTGSTEGLLDALAAKQGKPVIMEIGEFQNWVDQRHWQAKAAPMVTDMFNKYWFEMSLSQRGENVKPRASNYCALSITANVQPAVMQRFSSDRVALDSGFLSRFLLCNNRDNSFRYAASGFKTADAVSRIGEAVSPLEALQGKVSFCTRTSFGELVDEFEGAEFAPHWKRLINEYGPRFALMLTPQCGTVPRIEDEGCRKADVLIRWHYMHALDVFRWFDKDDAKYEKFLHTVFKAVGRCRKKATRTALSRKVGGSAKRRNEALEELVERGYIKEVFSGKILRFAVDTPPREWAQE